MSEKKDKKSGGIASWLIGDYSGQTSNSAEIPIQENDEDRENCMRDLLQRISDLENTLVPRLEALDLKVSKLIEANKNLIAFFKQK